MLSGRSGRSDATPGETSGLRLSKKDCDGATSTWPALLGVTSDEDGLLLSVFSSSVLLFVDSAEVCVLGLLSLVGFTTLLFLLVSCFVILRFLWPASPELPVCSAAASLLDGLDANALSVLGRASTVEARSLFLERGLLL